MNKKQKFISIIGIFIILIMGFIPPWKYIDNDSSTYREMPAGYYLIFSPPELDYEQLLGLEIDISRLAIQWITVLFMMAAALFITQEKRDATESDEEELL